MHGLDVEDICIDLLSLYDGDTIREIANTLPKLKEDLIDYIEDKCNIEDLRKAINETSSDIKFFNTKQF